MCSPPTFRRRFLEQLPGDPRTDNTTRLVRGACWSRVLPTPVAAPRLLAWSRPLAQELGLDELRMQDAATTQVLAGNNLWPGMDPYAANYGGHQFGQWAGQLGDGRAIVLGELERRDGTSVELQLKGAGPTPYSRRADGRAVLRSSLREFLCSEAMHHLGVPTTRALSLVATGDGVVRDMFYDGNPRAEPGAIVCRVAPSFLRFGSFELPSSHGDVPLLRRLADHVLTTFFPELGAPSADAHAGLYREITRRTAELVAHWQAVGFVHGVMNTDNMSLLGLTIDYGPYGWIDDFDFGWTPNTTDAGTHRYAFGNQPSIALWNVLRLGEALLPLLGDESLLDAAAESFQHIYATAEVRRYGAKIGLDGDRQADDEALLRDLVRWLSAQPIDMTLFFRALADVARLDTLPAALPAGLRATFYGPVPAAHEVAGHAWLARWWWRVREGRDGSRLAAAMDRVNPRFVLRNWVAQLAIEAAEQGDLGPLQRLQRALERPFDTPAEFDDLVQKRPEWARHKAGCSALSCSS